MNRFVRNFRQPGMAIVALFVILIAAGYGALPVPAQPPAANSADPIPATSAQEESGTTNDTTAGDTKTNETTTNNQTTGENAQQESRDEADSVQRVEEAMQQSSGVGLPGSGNELSPKIPEPVTHYLGREIAQTMSYHGGGAEWLIREEREREELCSLMLVNLGIRRGMAICDMGCGVGFHSIPLAQLTGENGYVAAVDVQPEMLVALRERTEQLGIENVIPILGSYHDPRLPPGMLDIVLMVDVYHEFSHPEPMLGAIRRSLKPDGQIVLLEYRSEDPDVPIKPLHKMSKEQIDKEMTANGFKLTQQFDDLPWQHMMFYGKDPDFDAEPDGREEK